MKKAVLSLSLLGMLAGCANLSNPEGRSETGYRLRMMGQMMQQASPQPSMPVTCMSGMVGRDMVTTTCY